MSDLSEALAAIPLLLVKSTTLLALAAIVNSTLRTRLSAAQRHLLWAVTLFSLLLLPLCTTLLPSWTLAPRNPDVAVWQVAASEAAPVERGLRNTSLNGSANATSTARAAVGTVADSDEGGITSISWEGVLLTLYGAGVLVMLARLVRQSFALQRLESVSTEERDGHWSQLLETQRSALGVKRQVRLLRSEALVTPMTWGIRTPTILMPRHADEWPVERRRAVLLHELAHVMRRDCLTQIVAAASEAFYWFHPGVWFAMSRLRVERELACDDVVLAAGVSPRVYASELLEIARTTQASRVGALALTFNEPSLLERRMRAILDGARHRAASRQSTVLACGLLMSVLVTAVSTAQPGAGGMSGLKEELRIGGDTPDLRFTNVDRIVVGRDGAMFISDSGGTRLRMYDARGRFVRRVGSRGDKPGQFREVIGMLITPAGELAVYDVFTSRISFFDTKGTFVRSIPSRVSGNWTGNDFHVDRDGNLYVFGIRYTAEGHTPTPAERARSQRFYLKLSRAGAILDTVDIPNSTVPPQRGGFVIMTPEAYLEPFPNRLVYDLAPNGRLVWGYTATYELQIGQRGGGSMPIRRQFTPLPLGAEERADWQARADYYSKQLRPGSASYGTVIPELKPAFRDVEVGEDGRIWVHRYSKATKRPISRPPSDSAPPPLTWREIPTFDVFEEDGRFFGTVILPENTRLLARDGSQLWGVQVNANRESFIVRYRLQ